MSLLKVEDLKIHYPVGEASLLGRHHKFLKAVDGVSFQLQQGKVLGVVGESGCGKSTLVRGILGLAPVTSGKISLLGKDILKMPRNERRQFRRNYQMIFQDSEASMNPRFTVGDIIAEPLKVFHPNLSTTEIQGRVQKLMVRVGLDPAMIRRYPHEFSGGQKQRICIARTLSLHPVLVVCDEAVSALDVSIQAQIINLLNELKKTDGLTYLFISHDLAVTRYISDEIMVMYLGKVVEQGPTDAIITRPQHPYTKALIAAVPGYKKVNTQVLQGEIPSPLNPPKGCSFCTRCPVAEKKCFEQKPELRALPDGRKAACHLL